MTFADLNLDCDVVIEDVTAVDRIDWLTLRQEGIGGSDAAATMGLSPWKSPFALYVDKVDEVTDDAPTERMLRGKQMEDTIARMFLEDTGIPVLGFQPMVRSRRHPFMLFTPDRILHRGSSVHCQLLECKNVGVQSAHEWADGPPLHYRIQVLHGLEVLGLKVGHLAALIGGNTFVHYAIEWDEQVLANIIKAEEKFWGEVAMRRPPEIDGTESTRDALAMHFKRPTLASVEVGPCMISLVDQRASAKRTCDIATSRLTAIENEMKLLIGDAEAATVDGEIVATWKSQDRKEHTVKASSSRVLRIPKGSP